VRFIGNRSSGKMGNELAAAALAHGAEVTLVTAAPPPAEQAGLTVVTVETADQMHAAVRAALSGARVLIMAAAVADWRPRDYAPHKLKKGADKDISMVRLKWAARRGEMASMTRRRYTLNAFVRSL
jgi:phosphopantothenoylcysteine decarboxylase/phosphopantothenate--cysteine ligase